MGLVNLIKSNIAKREIEKLNPQEEANKLADLVDQVLDDSLGNKESEKLQDTICNFVNKFAMAFTKRLKEGRK